MAYLTYHRNQNFDYWIKVQNF